MQRRSKVELFEQLRREYEFGVGTIAGVAKKFGVHRRMVRQAINSASPPARKRAERPCPQIEPVRAFIDHILEADRQAPRKQRHTAHRIRQRILQELPDTQVGASTVRRYVRFRKAELGLLSSDVCVPQAYDWGVEAQVDWYEATVVLDDQSVVVQFFALRSMASGAAFHRAYLRATQQSFLEAQQLAFHYFGGVFRKLRYDNLTSAVKNILRGHRREETERFIRFRSHWQFEASFCNPAQGHEKGGVEGEVGFFRRNHLVPVPHVSSLFELNQYLLASCQQDESRLIGERKLTVGQGLAIERTHLLPLQAEDFDLAEASFCRVDGKGCVCVRTNWYSTPLRVGTQAYVRVLPQTVEVWHEGKRVAQHERCYSRRQQVLSLEHYLDVLARKPGAFAGSKPHQQWRAEGRWPPAYDQLWLALQRRSGSQAGTRQMIELLQSGRRLGYQRLTQAIEEAIALGVSDAAAVHYLLTASHLQLPTARPLAPEEVRQGEYYARPLPEVMAYDELLSGTTRPTKEAC